MILFILLDQFIYPPPQDAWQYVNMGKPVTGEQEPAGLCDQRGTVAICSLRFVESRVLVEAAGILIPTAGTAG